MPSLASILKSIAYTWRNHTVVQFATFSVLVATFTVIFSILSISMNFNRILVTWGESVKVTAYLKDDLKPEAVSAVETSLNQVGDLRDIQFVSKEEAQKNFTTQMAKYSPDLLSDPEFANPFPANFQMNLSDRASYTKIEEIVKRVAQITGVDDVSYGQDWVENYSALVTAFSRGGWFVALVLLIGSAFVIGNSIRTSVNFRKDEIEILDLVGATKKMIWVPFVVDGTILGLASSVVALLIGYGIYIWGVRLFDSNLAFMALTAQFYYLDFGWIVSGMLLGASVGGVSSYFCVRTVNGIRKIKVDS